MKKLLTLFYALLSLVKSYAQCTDPSASNYNLHGLFDVIGMTQEDGDLISGPCCYETSMIISSLQGVFVEVNDYYQYIEGSGFLTLCLENGLYVVEVYFDETQPSQVAIDVSDGQSFSLNSSLGSPYVFEISIGEYVIGCTDPNACNFDPDATFFNFNCDYSCLGCTASDAINFDPNATLDNGTCLYNNYTLVATGPFSWSVFDGIQNPFSGVSTPVNSGNEHTAIIPGGDLCSNVQFTATDNQLSYSINIYNQVGDLLRNIESFDFSSSPIYYRADGELVGCSLPYACNYDPNEECLSPMDCNYDCYGCTNPLAINYDSGATMDDGTCCVGQFITFELITDDPNGSYSVWSTNGSWTNSNWGEESFCAGDGCIQVEANNLYAPATLIAYRSDGTILFQCSSSPNFMDTESINYTYCENDIWGCFDPFGCDYNPNANVAIPCDYSCHGCTDPTAPNYNPDATIENNTCCNDSWFTFEFSEPCFWSIYNPFTGFYMEGNYPQDNGYCSDQPLNPYVWGMTLSEDWMALEGSRSIADCFILEAISVSGNPLDFTITDGNGVIIASSSGNTDSILNADVSASAVEIPGCTDPSACNYNESASCNNGSCVYWCGGCTDLNALNYNDDASWNDGSCIYSIEAPVVQYAISAAALPNHFMIDFTIQTLGNSSEYILSSDYNTNQIIVDQYSTYIMGPYPCDMSISFKLRSLDFNLTEAWSAQDIQVLCTTLSDENIPTEYLFGVYPNPANDRITLTGLPNELHTIEIIDISGRIVKRELITGSNSGVAIDLNDLKSGAYIVRAFNGKNFYAERFIIEAK